MPESADLMFLPERSALGYDRNGTLMMGTFHPAALLRNPNMKGACLEDFLKLQDKIRELGVNI